MCRKSQLQDQRLPHEISIPMACCSMQHCEFFFFFFLQTSWFDVVAWQCKSRLAKARLSCAHGAKIPSARGCLSSRQICFPNLEIGLRMCLGGGPSVRDRFSRVSKTLQRRHQLGHPCTLGGSSKGFSVRSLYFFFSVFGLVSHLETIPKCDAVQLRDVMMSTYKRSPRKGFTTRRNY